MSNRFFDAFTNGIGSCVDKCDGKLDCEELIECDACPKWDGKYD